MLRITFGCCPLAAQQRIELCPASSTMRMMYGSLATSARPTAVRSLRGWRTGSQRRRVELNRVSAAISGSVRLPVSTTAMS
ncbi:hypothetical protein D3C81_2098350 [compost metagenome]